MPEGRPSLEAIAAARQRVAARLTAVTCLIYFGFVVLVALNKPLTGTVVARGLSVGLILGIIVILASWVLTLVYVLWANHRYDAVIRELQK